MQKTLSPSRLILVTTIGGCLEFFDFTIFALFSTYISQAFFPFDDHIAALIHTFAVFAVGYFARPIGGLIISHIGDRYGRKRSLVIAVNLMAFSTLAIALLPTYHVIGISASVLLVIFRLLQGAAMGGEMPGVITYLAEHFHTKRAILMIAIVFAGVTMGNTFASALGYLLSATFTLNQMIDFGWRIPFIIGGALGFIGYIIRSRTQETLTFIHLVAQHAIYKAPVKIAIKYHWQRILLATGMTALTSGTIFLFFYLPAFAHQILHHPIEHIYLTTTVAFTLVAVGTVGWAMVAERFGSFKVIFTGCLLTLALSISAVFWVLQIPHGIQIFSLLLALFASMVNSCYAELISRLFPANICYSGVATSYNLGVAFFGAIAPVTLASLYDNFHIVEAPFYFMAIASAIAVICFVIGKKLLRNADVELMMDE